jgi:hypothetical protein
MTDNVLYRRLHALLRDYDYQYQGEMLTQYRTGGFTKMTRYRHGLLDAVERILPYQDQDFKRRYHRIMAMGHDEPNYLDADSVSAFRQKYA